MTSQHDSISLKDLEIPEDDSKSICLAPTKEIRVIHTARFDSITNHNHDEFTVSFQLNYVSAKTAVEVTNAIIEATKDLIKK